MLRALALLAVLFTACGEERPAAQRDVPDGRLVIRESLPPMPRYIEGSVSFLRVVRTQDGSVVVDGPMRNKPLLDRAVAAGDYQVVSYQRPCDGNCGLLDPPVDRCEATVRVTGGHTRTATVVLGRHGGCTVSTTAAANREAVKWAQAHLPGMRVDRARTAAKARDLEVRVVRRDGRGLLITDDRHEARVDVEVRSRRVTRVVGLY